MSDFSDAEDRQLVLLARRYMQNLGYVDWDDLTGRMQDTDKTKDALRQRLKTLKRTYGSNIAEFPPWFFRQLKNVPHRQVVPTTTRTSNRGTSSRKRAKVVQTTSKNKRRPVATSQKKSSQPMPKQAQHQPQSSSLMLLASAAAAQPKETQQHAGKNESGHGRSVLV